MMSTEPEAELLFHLVSTRCDDGETESQIRGVVNRDVDWETVLQLVRRHGLSSRAYRALSDFQEDIPSGVWETLQSRHRENALSNLRHARQLHSLFEDFQRHDVKVLPYKGPTLAEAAYGNVGYRTFGDLDFLVGEEDLLRAQEVLRNRGYERTNFPDVRPEVLLEDSVLRWGEEFRFVKEGSDIPVELRFAFIGGDRPDSVVFRELWSRRTPLSLAGRTITALSPEDRMLLLLVHGTKHGWRRLMWAYDVALLLQTEIVWDQLLSRAERYGWRSSVLFGLAVTSELTGATIPHPVRQEVKRKPHYRLGARALAARLRDDPVEGLLRAEPLTTVLFLNDSIAGSLTELADVVLSPRKVDVEWITLPPNLYPLYYLVRPCRVGSELVDRVGRRRE